MPDSAKGSSRFRSGQAQAKPIFDENKKRDTKCTTASEDSAVELRSCSVPPGYDVSSLWLSSYPSKPALYAREPLPHHPIEIKDINKLGESYDKEHDSFKSQCAHKRHHRVTEKPTKALLSSTPHSD